jgi:hypothetical protein
MFAGDMVGPGFSMAHLDAPGIFNKMIHGDGQHYLFDIGMNMYWLKFLHAVNQWTPELLKGAIDGMNKGDTHVTYAVIRNINPQQYLIEKP